MSNTLAPLALYSIEPETLSRTALRVRVDASTGINTGAFNGTSGRGLIISAPSTQGLLDFADVLEQATKLIATESDDRVDVVTHTVEQRNGEIAVYLLVTGDDGSTTAGSWNTGYPNSGLILLVPGARTLAAIVEQLRNAARQ
jgi:hypothetical protein